jgi:uncharacterized membrane protein (DUF2068 family)
MEEQKRGGCLTTFLVLMLIANPLTALYYLVAGDAVRQALPALPTWGIPVLAALGILNAVFAIGVWHWQRWGAYGFIASGLVAFLFNVSYLGALPAVLGLIGPVILVLLVRPHWSVMQ